MIRTCNARELICDQCEQHLALVARSESHLRQLAAQTGWLKLWQRDLCPACQVSALREARHAPSPLEGHHRCVGRAPLPETASALAVPLWPPSPDCLANDQMVEYCDREPVAKEERACAASTIRRWWRRGVVTGRAVFASWIGM